jgi:hypothetical protein
VGTVDDDEDEGGLPRARVQYVVDADKYAIWR